MNYCKNSFNANDDIMQHKTMRKKNYCCSYFETYKYVCAHTP